jgi:hypothetical protein
MIARKSRQIGIATLVMTGDGLATGRFSHQDGGIA